MRILALETSTDVGSVAILEDGVCVTERMLRAPMQLLSWLSPAMNEILTACKLTMSDIHAIATGIGPGSFTGVRLELATARALAQVRGIPLYGVSSLDALAHQALPHQGTVLSLIDARRGEFFAGIYQAFDLGLLQLGDYLCLEKEKLFAEVSKHPGPYLVVGAASENLKGLPNAKRGNSEQGTVRASSTAFIAYERRHESSGNLYSVQPLYIRPSSAEIEREKTKPAKK